MGISIDQIVGELGKVNFACTICTDLLEDAVTIRDCEHNFCRLCLDGWIVSQTDESNVPCPECRTLFAKEHDVKVASRFIRNMLIEIRLMCPFEECGTTVRYDNFESHTHACQCNPANKVSCAGCDEQCSRQTLEEHTNGCIHYLRHEMSKLKLKTNVLAANLMRMEAERHVQDIIKVTLVHDDKIHAFLG